MKLLFTYSVLSLTLSGASAFSTTPFAGRSRTQSRLAAVVVEERPAPVAAEEPVNDAAPVAAAPVEAPAATSAPAAPAVAAPVAYDKDAIVPGRYNDKENSIALPFLKRPNKLDGTHAGDFGFDPLGFTETYDLYTLQESELRHARLAMLAVIGWPLSELVAPSWMLQGEYGCAPSVLNGFNPLSFIVTLGIFAGLGYFEYKTALRTTYNTKLGKIHEEDMKNVWKFGVAGDYDFDPLDLYSSIGNDPMARKGLREVEISHGRMAMLGITAFAAWEKLTGHPIVENSMFFHPNLLLPALAAGYLFFNQVYKVESDGQYLFQIRKTSEGEAMLENMKIGKSPSADFDTEQIMEKLGIVAEKASELASKAKDAYEKASESYLEYSTQNYSKDE